MGMTSIFLNSLSSFSQHRFENSWTWTWHLNILCPTWPLPCPPQKCHPNWHLVCRPCSRLPGIVRSQRMSNWIRRRSISRLRPLCRVVRRWWNRSSTTAARALRPNPKMASHGASPSSRNFPQLEFHKFAIFCSCPLARWLPYSRYFLIYTS